MSTTIGTERLADLVPDRVVLLWGALLVLLELLAVTLFVAQPQVYVQNPLVLVYPFVWINVGLWAGYVVSPPSAERHQRRGATLLVAAYLLVLGYAAGMLSAGGAPPDAGALSVRVASIPPGWGPYVTLYAPGFKLQAMPYQVIGYGALAFLLYATILEAATSAAGGVLGLLTCVSCSWPVLATLVSGLVGSAAGVAAAVYAWPYGLATVAYVLTMGVLVWRPTFGFGN